MKFLKLQQVMEKTSLCSSSIYNLMKEGDFPKNISVMGKRKAWLESDVEEWMLKKLQATESTS
ncbi:MULTISPECIES: AlpA family phage regulatory protein [Salinivibrio]|uniref:AlpA family phage regulatory protein n=1 Tax=Salinivibrio TaxID=51366 RepID=UPI00098A9866|nr:MULTISPECIES: AlpA family phage regulatory protein [Salinivibrio]OOF11736.1 transcriptional regulator [Salinivibrio sp. PR5]WBA18052.1 AlpA family phage regulatory protein [Salinivibrio kushneri]